MYFFQIISNLVEMKTSKVLASLCLGLVSVSIQGVSRNMKFEFSRRSSIYFNMHDSLNSYHIILLFMHVQKNWSAFFVLIQYYRIY